MVLLAKFILRERLALELTLLNVTLHTQNFPVFSTLLERRGTSVCSDITPSLIRLVNHNHLQKSYIGNIYKVTFCPNDIPGTYSLKCVCTTQESDMMSIMQNFGAD